MAVYEEYLNYRLTGRCSNPFWQRKFGGVSGGGGGTGGGSEPSELLSWEGVAYHINKGDYKDVYAIGDSVPLDLGSEGIISMQVAAFDTDDLADGSGKAPMTFIAKELLKTKHRMNPALVTNDDGTYQEGTGGIGGWEKCEMRTYLQAAIAPLVPEAVSGMIRSVVRSQTAYYTSGSSYTQNTTDSLWIPDITEVATGSYTYKELFPDKASRKKYQPGGTNGVVWYLRNANPTMKGYFSHVKTDGGSSSSTSQTENGICLGFCTGKTPT